MTKEEFQYLWTIIYPDSAPIPYLFKHDYPNRWFRIHSLPESKRYAENDEEWRILLGRQNEIITDLFGMGADIMIVTEQYYLTNEKMADRTDEVFEDYSFISLDNIDLHRLNPNDYDEGEIYRPAFAETIWTPNKQDKLLRKIANEGTMAFFLSFDKNVIVAPYDGGIDFVLKDNLTRDYYKNKYKEWLSERDDGL